MKMQGAKFQDYHSVQVMISRLVKYEEVGWLVRYEQVLFTNGSNKIAKRKKQITPALSTITRIVWWFERDIIIQKIQTKFAGFETLLLLLN